MKKHSTLPLPTTPPSRYQNTFVRWEFLNIWITWYRSFSFYFRRILGSFSLVLVFFICTTSSAFAQVIISEVYPNPSTSETEWIELFNPSTAPISLAGWKLQDKLSTPSDIYLFTTQQLEPQQFFVAELSSAKLNNTADGVTLFRTDGTTADSMDYTTSEQNKTWQRTTAASTLFILTTPTKGTNSALYPLTTTPSSPTIPTPTPSATPTLTTEPTSQPLQSTTPTPTPTNTPYPTSEPITTSRPLPSATPTSVPTPLPSVTPLPIPSPTSTPIPSVSPVVSPSPTPTSSPAMDIASDTLMQLQLSEIMACPASGTEWVEFYNTGTQNITFTNWHITDESGNSKTLSGAVEARKWAIFTWTGSLLNNAGDSFTITTTTGQTFSQVSYDSCSSGQSLVYTQTTDTASGTWLLATPTPNAQNSIPNSTASQTTAATSSAFLSTPATTPVTSQLGTALANLKNSKSVPELMLAKQLPFMDAVFAQDLSSILTLPQIATISGQPEHATSSAIFIDNSHLPSKRIFFSGILSGLATIGTSITTLYGKKILTFLAEA